MSIVLRLLGRGGKDKPDPGPKIVEKSGREPVHAFETVLAGTDLSNPDGKSRQEIIRRTEEGSETILMLQRGTMGLVAVYAAATGEQLGFLNREVSQKIAREARSYDFRSFVQKVEETAEPAGLLSVTLAIEVFQKP